MTEARPYGANDLEGVGGTGSVFRLRDEPEVAAYLFLGGVAAGSALFGAGAAAACEIDWMTGELLPLGTARRSWGC